MLLSMRNLAFRLANLAATGSGISSIHAPVAPSPLTGSSIPRVTLDVHHRARESSAWGGRPNDPDYDPPERGRPLPAPSPAQPPARSDPNSLMYDNNPNGAGAGVGRCTLNVSMLHLGADIFCGSTTHSLTVESS